MDGLKRGSVRLFVAKGKSLTEKPQEIQSVSSASSLNGDWNGLQAEPTQYRESNFGGVALQKILDLFMQLRERHIGLLVENHIYTFVKPPELLSR